MLRFMTRFKRKDYKILMITEFYMIILNKENRIEFNQLSILIAKSNIHAESILSIWKMKNEIYYELLEFS